MSDINTNTNTNGDNVTTPPKPTLENTLTGYGVWKVSEKALTEAGLKPITPQMVYQYMNQNLIPTVTVGEQERVRRTDAAKWVAKFVRNRQRRLAESA